MMIIYAKQLTLFVFCVIQLSGLIGCGRIGTLFPVSDVPCFQPTAWSSEGARDTLIRAIPGVEGALLFTQQTSAQRDEDRNDGDGMRTFLPHDPVYRFSPDTGIIELVDSSVWDNLTTPIRDCSSSNGDVTPFQFAGLGRPQLLFEGETIPVTGGTFVSFDGAFNSAVIAVESTDGSFGLDIPFVPGRTSNGQHFHQLFSKVDGSPIGEAVRLGVGDDDPCWTFDEKYVIYNGNNPNGERTICIVPIVDELPQFGN